MEVPRDFIPKGDFKEKIKEYLGIDNFLESIKDLHIDPNLTYAVSVAVICIEFFTIYQEDLMMLSVPEKIPMVLDRKGINHGNLIKSIQRLRNFPETKQGKCMFAGDIFKTLEQTINLETAKDLYNERIKIDVIGTFLGKQTIKKRVMDYANMVIGIDAENLGPDKIWRYRDPKTQQVESIKIDEKYINSIENQLDLRVREEKEDFRTRIGKLYLYKIKRDPGYDFMDNPDLVKAVTEVELKSNIETGSLVRALVDRSNEENRKCFTDLVNNMIKYSGYCNSCAEKTLKYYITNL